MSDKYDLEKRLEYLRIDEATKKSMRDFYGAVKSETPDFIAEFYQYLSGFEETKKILSGHSDIKALTAGQVDHWDKLFSGDYDTAYIDRALSVGKVHEVIGLTPRWYLGGYFLILEKMICAFLQQNGVKSPQVSDQIGAMLRAVCLDIDLAMMAFIENSELRSIHEQLLQISDDILTEADETIQSVSDQTDLMQTNVQMLSEAQIELEKQVNLADASLTHTVQAIHTVATATEELDASSQSIANQVQTSQSIAEQAIEQSERSRETVNGLEASAQEISSVVGLVQKIASQTRLLALNATIEAARAGEAGKGFAVVASEVKNLAAETEKAIEQVNAQAEQIQKATERASREIELTNKLIQDMGDNVGAIAESVEQQTVTTSEISNSASSASETTSDVDKSMKDVGGRNVAAQAVARKVSNISNNVVRDVRGLSDAMVLLLRTSYAGDRRQSERVPLGMQVKVLQEGNTILMSSADLGLGGISLRLHDANAPIKEGPCSVDLPDIGALDGEVKHVSDLIVNVSFGRHNDESRHKILDKLAKTKDHDQVYIDLVQEGAKRAEAAFEDALQKDKIAFEDFFDIDYQPIPNTNPRQILTKFTPITDEYLPAIQEELLTRAENVVLACCVDRAAYLPTHNMIYSKEQGDDPVWNDANCRNRRIFADPAGLRAARNRAPVLVQAYDRVVGGQRVLLKEVDAPIHIRGRHWGNMRMAYKF